MEIDRGLFNFFFEKIIKTNNMMYCLLLIWEFFFSLRKEIQMFLEILLKKIHPCRALHLRLLLNEQSNLPLDCKCRLDELVTLCIVYICCAYE